MSLDYVKKLAGDNPVIEDIYNRMTERMLVKLSSLKLQVVPAELEFIVEEATITRFNLVGSEGMRKETVEGHSAEYLTRDPLEAYQDIIDDYIALHSDDERKEGVLYFL